MNKFEVSLLLYFETRMVDYGGTVESRRLKQIDKEIIESWKKSKFIKFGDIDSDDVKSVNGIAVDHWVQLSNEAWAESRKERRLRAKIKESKLIVKRLGADDVPYSGNYIQK